MHDQDVLQRDQHADMREALERVVTDFLDRRADHQRADMRHADRVAVRFRVRQDLHRDHAVGAGAIVDDDLGAKTDREFGLQDARNQVGGATGREADNKTHRFGRRPVGGKSGRGNE